jgi:hypothetical protein
MQAHAVLSGPPEQYSSALIAITSHDIVCTLCACPVQCQFTRHPEPCGPMHKQDGEWHVTAYRTMQYVNDVPAYCSALHGGGHSGVPDQIMVGINDLHLSGTLHGACRATKDHYEQNMRKSPTNTSSTLHHEQVRPQSCPVHHVGQAHHAQPRSMAPSTAILRRSSWVSGPWPHLLR